MLKFFPLILILLIISGDSTKAQKWEVIKQLPAKPTKTLNVDTDPTVELRPPIIWSVSFPDELNGWAACDNGVLLITSDGGKNWKEYRINPRVNTSTPLFLHSIDVFFLNKQKGWIAAEYKNKSAILTTENGGKNWKVIYQPNFRGGLYNLYFIDEQRGWAVGEAEDTQSDGGIIYTTKDGGKNWKLQYSSNDDISNLSEIKFADDLNGWAVGDNSILHTSNGGKNWQRQNIQNDAFLFGVEVLSVNEVWVVGSNGTILHTVDAGNTWSQSKLPNEYENHWLNSIKFVESDKGWIVGNDGIIFSSIDRGKTWTIEEKARSSYLCGITATNNHLFTFGNDGVILRKSLN